MNSMKDWTSEIKYLILKILDLSILQDLSPEIFRKLKRKEYIEYLINNWTLDELLLEIAIHPSIDEKKWKSINNILREKEMNEFRVREEEIKYEFLKNLDQIMLMKINPIQFKKLKRRNFIDYLVKTWSLDDIVSELLIDPEIYEDKHKINFLLVLFDIANKKLDQAKKKKYTRIFNHNLEMNRGDKKSNKIMTTQSISKKQMTLDKFILK
jgi:hypothetical protein